MRKLIIASAAAFAIAGLAACNSPADNAAEQQADALEEQAADASPPKGLRRWLRRPDHLGDLAVWWGLFLIAAETGPGRASVLGPIFLTWAVAHWIRTENPRRERDGG